MLLVRAQEERQMDDVTALDHWLTAFMRVKIQSKGGVEYNSRSLYAADTILPHRVLPSVTLIWNSCATYRSTASREHSIEEHTGTPKPSLNREPESGTERSFYREKCGRRYRGPCRYNTLKFSCHDVSELGDAESSSFKGRSRPSSFTEH